MTRAQELILCIIVGGTFGSWYSEQPFIARYFDFILHRVSNIGLHERTNMVQAIRSIHAMITHVYAGCRVTHRTTLQIHSTNTLVPRFCGTISYTRGSPVQYEWKIHPLHYYNGIKLSVLYLKLPFLGFSCDSGNVTISALGGEVLCGIKSGIVVYSSIVMTIQLKQGYHLGKDFGFIAAYHAYQIKNFPHKTFQHVYWIRKWYTLKYISPFYDNMHQEGAHSWHIVALPFQSICFKRYFPYDNKIHDGPWVRSQALERNCTTGYCAYIVQENSQLSVAYEAVIHSTYDISSNIDIKSSTLSNTVHIYQVSGSLLHW